MKVLITYDVDGWAQHRHAIGIAKHAPKDYDVTVRSLDQWHNVATPQWRDRFDVIYCIYLYAARFAHRHLASCVASHAWKYDKERHDDWQTRGVNRSRNSDVGQTCLRWLKSVVCRNNELSEWASQYHNKVKTIPAGVDTSTFTPTRPRRTRQLRVGWCGQVSEKHPERNFKGYAEIVEPLMKRCFNQCQFTCNTSTYTTKKAIEEQSQWYRSLDVFLSTSMNDATPNPPFEAAACGVPVISTDVGQVSDWNDLRLTGMIVPRYRNAAEAASTVDAIAERLAMLEDQRIRERISDQLVLSIRQDYCYSKIGPKILEFVCHGADV